MVKSVGSEPDGCHTERGNTFHTPTGQAVVTIATQTKDVYVNEGEEEEEEGEEISQESQHLSSMYHGAWPLDQCKKNIGYF